MKYEERVRMELVLWEKTLSKRGGVLEQTSKAFSTSLNRAIPEKVHHTITQTIKSIVKAVIVGARFTPNRPVETALTLEQRDQLAEKINSQYKKIAAAEGAGTGAGGLLLGVVDFPALLAIKMKFLFEIAHTYGFDTKEISERLYILYIFQLAFSSREHRMRTFKAMKSWNQTRLQWADETDDFRSIDWQTLQQEYRDSIDFRKMLQLLPGIGAIVGAWANYGLLEELHTAASNAYRMRLLDDPVEA
ncbi:EcsC family protein [Paenibacillus senegalensis]|uniref:EcsC family protein n=1 Tax=Paenibacillus senegalensis TaxID=1465766 RepID=UPI00028904C5|nr:EcsC family protein [Paenibacillus senegalensis]